MQQLYYADEVRSFADVPRRVGRVSAEGARARQAPRRAERDATPSSRRPTRTTSRSAILGLIQKKVEGQEISIAPPEAGGGQIIDLMEALKASLAKKPEAASARRAEGGGRPENPPRKPAKRAPARVAPMRTESARKA